MSLLRRKPLLRPVLLILVFILILAVSAASIGALEGPDKQAGDLTEAVAKITKVSSFDAAEQKAAVLAQDAAPEKADGHGTNVEDLEAVSIIIAFEDDVSDAQLEAVSGGEVIHRYKNVLNGVSMVVAGDEIESIAAVNGVKTIYLDELQQLDTEASPSFMGAPALWNDLGGQDVAGEGVVVGVLDTGIWPEHPSFADPDGFGAYPPPPGGPYTCDFGDTAYNPADAPFTCNNKLIGAYDFLVTYKAVTGLLPNEFDSARDADGHGTHTASTAAGNGSVAASIFGVPRGVVSGIAPRAHVIMYKVCGDLGCYNSDSVAAVDQAVADGVDAINFSISGGGDPYSDVVSLAFLNAYENGVFVAASAGNSGPDAETVAHREPWTTTVAASTSDRHFIATVDLVADNNDTLTLEGATVTDGIASPTDVVYPPAGEELCLTPFATGTFSGEIVICERGAIARVEKSFNVAAGGAGGMLLYNPVNQGLATDNHFIPSVHLDGDEGIVLNAFMAAHSGVTATFTGGVATVVQGDKMADFSSRGGPLQTLGVSKPDITAPGVQILAGHTPLPATVVGGLPGEHFQSIQGTSMSSPHIAGSAALVKAAHPDWTPGQIKSALMMSAVTDGVTKEDGVTPADAFDYGSGRADLSMAADVSMTISDSGANLLALQDELWNANLPSLYHPVMPGKITVDRMLHNTTGKRMAWNVKVYAPEDLKIYVPRKVSVTPNRDKLFRMRLDARHVPIGETRMAMIEFKHGSEVLHFPVTIVRRQPVVTMEKSCTPDQLAKREVTSCTITVQNTSFDEAQVSVIDRLPRQLRLIAPSIVGASKRGNGVKYHGTLSGAEPPLVDVAVDPLASPFGYVPLAGFGPVDVGASDESIANYNVPSFVYAGEVYSQIGIVSNGYIVVGGGTGADVDFINSDLPDAAIPNNVLAPFWTDLNPGAGGRVLIQTLTSGADAWIVVEWESVPNWGDSATNTAQVWIGYTGGVEDISFVYGPDVSAGADGFLTVGAENQYGNSGGTTYFDGVGTPPAPSFPNGTYEVDVFSVPGAPGETHTISFDALTMRNGTWGNCAEMTSDLFQGTSLACFYGEVRE